MELLVLSAVVSLALGALTHNSSSERRLSPDELGLRPDTTEDFTFPHIAEPVGRQFDPRPQDLNTTVLRSRLGRHFDPHYMSISRPRLNYSQPAVEFPFKQRGGGGGVGGGGAGGGGGGGRLVPAPGAEMPPFLRKMNFKALRLPDGSRLKTRVSARLQRKLQLFLWAYTACPVVHSWRDLGVRYWPRYVRRGSCPSAKGSCSIPPGMHCVPSQRVLKVILRWQCQDGPFNCQWIELKNFPIVTGCACSCPSKGSS